MQQTAGNMTDSEGTWRQPYAKQSDFICHVAMYDVNDAAKYEGEQCMNVLRRMNVLCCGLFNDVVMKSHPKIVHDQYDGTF